MFQEIELKAISQDLFKSILSNHGSELNSFIGDINTCCLVKFRTLTRLKVEHKSWLKLIYVETTTQNTNTPKTVDAEWWCNRMPNPPFSTGPTFGEDPVEKLEPPHRFLQCFLVNDDNVEDFILYVAEEIFFDIRQELKLPWFSPCVTQAVEAFEPGKCYFPDVASCINIAIVSSTFEIQYEDTYELLHRHFETPKYLVENDVFSICLSECAPHMSCSKMYFDIPCVYFKVLTIQGPKKTKEKCKQKFGYFIIKDHTSLYITDSVHSFIPPQFTKCVHTISSYFDIPLCPTGLDDNYKTMYELLHLFVRMDSSEARPKLLLTGPRGSGKRTVLYAVSKALGCQVLTIDCFDLYGQSASVVEGKFSQIFTRLKRILPCILLLVNTELLGKDKDDLEDDRVLTSFSSHLDELFTEKHDHPAIVIGLTNQKMSTLSPQVARHFVENIEFKAPDAVNSCKLLDWLVKSKNLSCERDVLESVVKKTSGFVFADLELLVQHAVRFLKTQDKETVSKLTFEHFSKGIEVMDSAYSDTIGAPKIPSVYWNDVGGLTELKEEINNTITFPLKYPHLASTGLRRSGILLYGPPGTGKTLIAKAVATEFSLNFLSVKGPELMNMYVGQSEQNVREVFSRAREASPCIIFFDELDSLAPNRGRSGDSGGVTDRVVSQLLAEMDGLQKNVNLFVIAATNRPDLVDPALLRPGRFDKMLYVGACVDVDSKLGVFKALTRKFALDPAVDLEELSKMLPAQVTGADLYSVCSNAWMAAATKAIKLMENGTRVDIPIMVTPEDFKHGLQQLVPSVKEEDLRYYEQLKSLER